MYIIRKTKCNCHPETCCCSGFEILFNGKIISRGNNKKRMLKLINKANQTICEHWDKIELECMD